tara:strand:- start:385 stop:1512 length:1128 start_codon:yes stop_codon:yes gene_type:complete
MNYTLTPVRIVTLSLVAACLSSFAAAQNCGVRNGFRIVNSHAGGSSELAVDTGWQTAAPLVTPGANSNPGQGTGCSSQGTCTPTSNYGLLRVTGTGSANNCSSGGTFLWLDQGPQARFFDTLTVVSSTLPAGTPVQLRMVLALSGSASVVDPNPAVSYNAIFYGGSLTLSLNSINGTTSGLYQLAVGNSMQVYGSLTVALYAYGMLGFGAPPFYGSYATDLTARMGIECLTPGASLSFCSGNTYQTLAAEVVPVGGGCGPGSPAMTASLPLLGQSQNFAVTGAAPNAPAFLAFAPGSAVSIPLGPCTITEAGVGLLLLQVATTDASGGTSYALALPSTPSLAGAKYTTQTMVLSAGGPLLNLGQLSNGLQSSIGI